MLVLESPGKQQQVSHPLISHYRKDRTSDCPLYLVLLQLPHKQVGFLATYVGLNRARSADRIHLQAWSIPRAQWQRPLGFTGADNTQTNTTKYFSKTILQYPFSLSSFSIVNKPGRPMLLTGPCLGLSQLISQFQWWAIITLFSRFVSVYAVTVSVLCLDFLLQVSSGKWECRAGVHGLASLHSSKSWG